MFASIAESFLEFIGNAELIIHNAPFDQGFLDHELRLLGLETHPEAYGTGAAAWRSSSPEQRAAALQPADDAAGAPRVVVLGESLWR